MSLAPRIRDPLANGLGIVAPATAAVALTPFLLGRMGSEMFGLFAIQLAALTILSVNDFGISRAIVLVGIARAGSSNRVMRVRTALAGLHLVATLAVLIAAVGGMALIVMVLVAPADLIVSSLLVLASGLISLVILPLRASMEVERRFVVLNLLRGAGSAALFVGPAAALSVDTSLTACALAWLVTRLLLLAGFVVASGIPVWRATGRHGARYLAGLRTLRLPELHSELVRRGSWLGLAGMLSLILGYIDRFVTGFIAGPAAVASYTVASELASKVWLVIGAFTNAETPRIASHWDASARRFDRGALRFITAIAFIISAGTAASVLVASDWVLQVWLGDNVQPDMAPILRLLALGVAMNCLTQVNFLVLMIGGGERAGATLMAWMLPLTAIATVVAVKLYGPIGAAAVFALRLFVDSMAIRRLVIIRIGTHDGLSTGVLVSWGLLLFAGWAAQLTLSGGFTSQ